MSKHLSMEYLLSNICTKNYWNRTTIVETIVGGWVVSFFETQCSFYQRLYDKQYTAILRYSVPTCTCVH